MSVVPVDACTGNGREPSVVTTRYDAGSCVRAPVRDAVKASPGDSAPNLALINQLLGLGEGKQALAAAQVAAAALPLDLDVMQALGRAKLTVADIDLFEINEAFAAQVVPSADDLGISWDKLNANGGAIAIGHPFGMTGARIMTTLLNGLDDADKEFGVEAMCVGGGQGMAMVIQRLR